MLFRVNILTLILFRIFSENKTAKIQNSANYKTAKITKQRKTKQQKIQMIPFAVCSRRCLVFALFPYPLSDWATKQKTFFAASLTEIF